MRPFENPNGIPSQSPGLRSPSQTGEDCATLGHRPQIFSTATRLRPFIFDSRWLPLGLKNADAICHSSAMPQSLSAVYIHLVFSTKDRRPMLRDKATRDELHAYLGGISKQLDCAPIQIGGVEDHVHILARFARTVTQAEWVKELKRVSNAWLKERDRTFADFEWQGGYAAFSVSQSNLESVKQYIAGQEEHHRKVNFQDELRILLRKHEVEWDEKYVWE